MKSFIKVQIIEKYRYFKWLTGQHLHEIAKMQTLLRVTKDEKS